MTAPARREPAPARSARRAGAGIGGHLLLILLLVGFALLAGLPNTLGEVRLAGVSILWWYGGVIAPALAWLIVLAFLRRAAGADPSPPHPHS